MLVDVAGLRQLHADLAHTQTIAGPGISPPQPLRKHHSFWAHHRVRLAPLATPALAPNAITSVLELAQPVALSPAQQKRPRSGAWLS